MTFAKKRRLSIDDDPPLLNRTKRAQRSGKRTALRKTTLPAGPVELAVRIDFAKSLPALLLQGEDSRSLDTGEGWESSLDFHSWVPVETYPFFYDPEFLPDQDREVTVEIPPKTIVSRRGVVSSPSGWKFERGGELIVDLFHDELGHVAFDLSGEGEPVVDLAGNTRHLGSSRGSKGTPASA